MSSWLTGSSFPYHATWRTHHSCHFPHTWTTKAQEYRSGNQGMKTVLLSAWRWTMMICTLPWWHTDTCPWVLPAQLLKDRTHIPSQFSRLSLRLGMKSALTGQISDPGYLTLYPHLHLMDEKHTAGLLETWPHISTAASYFCCPLRTKSSLPTVHTSVHTQTCHCLPPVYCSQQARKPPDNVRHFLMWLQNYSGKRGQEEIKTSYSLLKSTQGLGWTTASLGFGSYQKSNNSKGSGPQIPLIPLSAQLPPPSVKWVRNQEMLSEILHSPPWDLADAGAGIPGPKLAPASRLSQDDPRHKCKSTGYYAQWEVL